MHKTPEGVYYTIEIDDSSAVLIIYGDGGIETRLDGFKSIREMLNYVNDLSSWENRRRG